jgi:hypothetical protein
LLDARAYLESQFNHRMKSRIRIGNGKSASLQRLVSRCWRGSRYPSGETSNNRTSGPE